MAQFGELFSNDDKPTQLGGPAPVALNPTFQQDRAMMLRLASEAKRRNAPTAGYVDKSDQAKIREGQTGLIKTLEDQAAGIGPSLAQDELKRATDRTLANIVAMQSGNRGQSAGVGARTAARALASTNQEAAGQAATTRLQEQLLARDLLAKTLESTRGQDIGIAGLDQQVNLANLQANLQQQAMNDALRSFGIENYLGINEDQLNRGLQSAMGNLEAENQRRARRANAYQVISDNATKVAQSMIESGGKSDERAKENIRDGTSDIEEFLSRFEPKSFEYKDKNLDGSGQHVGVMAQDLEKAGPAGRAMVENTPLGKMLNANKGFGTLLAAAADIHKRLAALESKKGKKK